MPVKARPRLAEHIACLLVPGRRPLIRRTRPPDDVGSKKPSCRCMPHSLPSDVYLGHLISARLRFSSPALWCCPGPRGGLRSPFAGAVQTVILVLSSRTVISVTGPPCIATNCDIVSLGLIRVARVKKKPHGNHMITIPSCFSATYCRSFSLVFLTLIGLNYCIMAVAWSDQLSIHTIWYTDDGT